MVKSLFEQIGGTYTQVGDYLLPDLILPNNKLKQSEYGDSDTQYN